MIVSESCSFEWFSEVMQDVIDDLGVCAHFSGSRDDSTDCNMDEVGLYSSIDPMGYWNDRHVGRSIFPPDLLEILQFQEDQEDEESVLSDYYEEQDSFS
jgi:hypothetical protein